MRRTVLTFCYFSPRARRSFRTGFAAGCESPIRRRATSHRGSEWQVRPHLRPGPQLSVRPHNTETGSRAMQTTRLTRRNLLHGAAATLVSAAAAPRFRPLAPCSLSNSATGIGVIGCGSSGTAHLTAIEQHPALRQAGLRIAAACDTCATQRSRARSLTHAPVYQDYRELLARESVDAVLIATPDHLHGPMALDAIRAGKDVFIEPPMALERRDALQIAREAESRGRVVQVGVASAADPRWMSASRLVIKGLLGTVVWSQSGYCRSPGDAATAHLARPVTRRRWRADPTLWHGPTASAFHDRLACLQIALGAAMPRRVAATGPRPVDGECGLPGTLFVNIEYPGNHTVVLVTSVAPNQCIPEIIRGRDATLFFNPRGLSVLDSGGRLVTEAVADAAQARSPLLQFAESVRTRRRPPVDAFAGCCTVTAISLGMQSYREGRAVPLEDAAC